MGRHGNHAFSHSLLKSVGPRDQVGTNSKLPFACKVGQIRSWGTCMDVRLVGIYYIVSFFSQLLYLTKVTDPAKIDILPFLKHLPVNFTS